MIEHAASANIDDLVERCRGCGKTVQKADPTQCLDLVAGDFLDTELAGKNRVTVDQRDPIALPPEKDRGQRSGQAATDNGDLRIDSRRQ